MSRSAINVRPVELSDQGAIVRIDEKLSGQTRKDYWEHRLEIAALRPPWMSLVAETDGRAVGFLFGWVGESDFERWPPVSASQVRTEVLSAASTVRPVGSKATER